MSVESPRIRSLLRQADSVAAAGKRAAAEQLYRQILDEAPDTAEAWRGLANVSRNSADRDDALRRAQELDPEEVMLAEAPANETADQVDVLAQPAEESVELPRSEDGRVNDGRDLGDLAATEIAVSGPDQEAGHAHSAEAVVDPPGSEVEVLYCANHPGRQTHLRCNRCGKPICSSCANPTPVGYRCPECIREQEDVFYTATPLDYLVTFLVAFPVSLAVGWVATLILSSAFGFFLIFLGAFAGSLVGRVAFRVAGRRRGRWLPHLVVVCVIVGGILPALGFVLAAFLGQFSLRLIFLGIYLVTAAGATFYQMR